MLLFEDFINERNTAKGKKTPINSAKIEKALKRKSEKTGIPISHLRTVMRRGMAAWKSGHRPGAGQEQWGYARVNSFATGQPTTWGSPKNNPKGGADSDVAKRVIKGGRTEKLKFIRKKKVNEVETEEFKHKYYKNLSKSTIEAKKRMMKKQAEMDDSDPTAYKELPGDDKGKRFLRKSKHTKRFEEMFGDD
jgi:hypothetical protein